jgi:hypothetical protein
MTRILFFLSAIFLGQALQALSSANLSKSGKIRPTSNQQLIAGKLNLLMSVALAIAGGVVALCMT